MRRTLRVLLALSAVTALGACGSTGDPAGARAAPAGSAPGFPVDVTNCGRTLHFDQPPTRIVSGWPTNTELLLALGAAGSIVGQYNTSTGTVTGKYAGAYAEVPVLGTDAPSREQLVAAAPQLIWADGEYLFDGKRLPTITELNEQGIQVMILSGFCTADASRAQVTDVNTDVATLGRILDRGTEADRISQDVAARLAAVDSRAGGKAATPAALISTFDKQIYAYEGVYSDIASRAGARNVYTGVLPKGSYFGEVSAEDLIQRDPATLVYLLSGGETEAAARTYLTRTLPSVAAVRTGRIVFLPQNDSTNLAGVAGVEKLSLALTGLGGA